MFWRCLHESSSGRFLGGSCIKILKDPLQQQQVLLTILWDSVGGAGPASRSCSRSFSVPYAKIRLKSSLQGPCIKILNVLLGCSQEVLVWRCALYIDLYIRSCCSSCNPAYNLICYCSIATVACIWYIDFLPATLFGASCRCNSRERLSRNKVLTLFWPYSMIILVDP